MTLKCIKFLEVGDGNSNSSHPGNWTLGGVGAAPPRLPRHPHPYISPCRHTSRKTSQNPCCCLWARRLFSLHIHMPVSPNPNFPNDKDCETILFVPFSGFRLVLPSDALGYSSCDFLYKFNDEHPIWASFEQFYHFMQSMWVCAISDTGTSLKENINELIQLKAKQI